MGMDFDVVVHGDLVAEDAGVRGTPTVFVLDGDDTVRLRTSDSDPDNPALRDAVAALMPPPAAPVDPRRGVFRGATAYPGPYAELPASRTHDVHAGGGQALVFVHGNPTSGYPCRNALPLAEPHGRVIAVDSAGFGESDKPAPDDTCQTHARYIETRLVGYAAHLVQEDSREAISRGIADWHRRHFE